MKKVEKTSDITIRVGLDEENLPTTLHWLAEADEKGVPNEIKAMILGVFDANKNETFKIDLWTKEFEIGQMNQFIFELLHSISDTYFRATKNEEMKNEMKGFAQFFGEKVSLLKKEGEEEKS